MNARYTGESIYYAGHLDRVSRYQVFAYEGKLYDCHGEAINTGKLNFDSGAMLVMDKSGHLFLTHKKRGEFHHSTFLAGQEVAYACMLEVQDGKIVQEEVWSGHYSPDDEQQAQFHDRLQQDFTDSYDAPPHLHMIRYSDAPRLYTNAEARCQICKQSAIAYMLNQRVRQVYEASTNQASIRMQAVIARIAEQIDPQKYVQYFQKRGYNQYTYPIVARNFDELTNKALPEYPGEVRNDIDILFLGEYFLKVRNFERARPFFGCYEGGNYQYDSHLYRLLQEMGHSEQAGELRDRIKGQFAHTIIENNCYTKDLAFFAVCTAEGYERSHYAEDYLLNFKLDGRRHHESTDAWKVHELTLVTRKLIDYFLERGDQAGALTLKQLALRFSLPFDKPLFASQN
jgi:hypothetical protein